VGTQVSNTDICNRALLAIGSRVQISSVMPSDGSTQGDACATLFTPTFESLARAAQWNCLRQQASLTLLQAAQGTAENPTGSSYPTPPLPWLYAYLLPPDCLKLWSIVPFLQASVAGVPLTTINNAAATWLPNSGAVPFAVAYGVDAQGNPRSVILTNQSQALANYTVNQPNPVIWDSQFQAAMVASLGAFLVPALSMKADMLERQVKLATSMIDAARASDGNEGVTTMDHVPDWIIARGGANWNLLYGQNNVAQYDNIFFPSW